MGTAAAIVAVVTVLGGLVLAGSWVRAGGLRRPAPEAVSPADVMPPNPPDRSRFSLARVGTHGVLGAGVAVVVVASAVSDDWHPMLIVMLLVVAAIGVSMALQWFRDRRNEPRSQRPEQALSLPVVAAHGLAAVATLVLTTIAVLS